LQPVRLIDCATRTFSEKANLHFNEGQCQLYKIADRGIVAKLMPKQNGGFPQNMVSIQPIRGRNLQQSGELLLFIETHTSLFAI
jgi:hypothetical protein